MNNNTEAGACSMSTITKEQLIEDLKASTQNSSGMFEIGEETICALMSLLAAPPAPVSVPDFGALTKCIVQRLVDYSAADDDAIASAEEFVYNACRAATLQGTEPVNTAYKLRDAVEVIRNSGIAIDAEKILAERDALNSPVIPDGYCIMPMKLTAENGAKGALSGEFSETKFINCPECFGDDDCETCDGSGRIEISVPVTWTTIKAIWAKGVEHFTAAPQQEVKQ